MPKVSVNRLKKLYYKPFNELIYQAHTVYKKNFDNEIELCTLLNIKTGNCPEDCKYCSQSGFNNSVIKKEKFLSLDVITSKAKLAKSRGASRFCIGCAWRSPPKNMMPKIIEIIKSLKLINIEVCMTLGMLSDEQVKQLSNAGLDYYNHNIDTSEKFYPNIVTTRSYQSRLDTIKKISHSNIKICCGGIIGMGETLMDRLEMISVLSSFDKDPQSIPINQLIPIPGTPIGKKYKIPQIDTFEFIRLIAVVRITFPFSKVRLAAGRINMSDEMQSLCFFAGANSIFYGDKLLTSNNPISSKDLTLLTKLGIKIKKNEK